MPIVEYRNTCQIPTTLLMLSVVNIHVMIFIMDIFLQQLFLLHQPASKSFLVSTMAGADVEMAANAEMLRQMQWEILVEFNNDI